MSEKILGYVLLAAGLLVIIFSTISVHKVFTAQSQPAKLFNFPAISLSPEAIISGQLPPEMVAAQGNLGLEDIELLPADVLNNTSNTIAHLLLMGFLVSAGFKVAMLGVNVLKPVVVKIKDEKVKEAVAKNAQQQ